MFERRFKENTQICSEWKSMIQRYCPVSSSWEESVDEEDDDYAEKNWKKNNCNFLHKNEIELNGKTDHLQRRYTSAYKLLSRKASCLNLGSKNQIRLFTYKIKERERERSALGWQQATPSIHKSCLSNSRACLAVSFTFPRYD